LFTYLIHNTITWRVLGALGVLAVPLGEKRTGIGGAVYIRVSAPDVRA
jgi:hypothetical protein